MSAQIQSILALAIVAVAAVWLVMRAIAKRRSSGCGSGECGAISPKVKKLQAKLKRR